VERLEGGAAPHTVVHARPAPAERVRQPAAVNPARPAHVPRAVVLLGPLALEHGLRPAVADLLLPVGAQRVASMMPHHGGGVEAERPAALLQPPGHVHVVAGGAELRVEAAERLEARLPAGHVAAWDM